MNKNTNYIIGILLVSIGIVLGVLGTTVINNYKPNTLSNVKNSKDELNYLLEILKDYSYFYENEDKLMEGAFKGIMESLGDPYSVYFSEEDYKAFMSQVNADIAGAGIYALNNGPYPIIVDVLQGSPADKAGLKKGQTIISIDDNDLEYKTINEVHDLIGGEKGTIRKFVVFEDDFNQKQTINVTLDKLNNPTVEYNYFEENNKKIGYLKINIFSSVTYNEFINAISYLESAEIEDLIVDVRGNGGGYLDIVKDILDYFINSDKPFIYEESRDKQRNPFYLNKNKREIDYNIVVLIDGNSASASEIFASTMNELGNYQLVGKTTFGKGTVQITTPINPDETKNIKLTTDIWLTSKGEWINHKGIIPTIEVDLTNFDDLSYIDSSQDIRFDHVNYEIMDVQALLNKFGYNIRQDGYFDINTKNAVESYQTANNISVSGIVDNKTAYEMNLDLIEYIYDKANDNQYQAALNYLINN